MVLWGLYPIFTHYFVRSLDPVFLSSVSTVFSSVPFLVMLLFSKNKSYAKPARILKPIFLTAFFAGVGSMLLFTGTRLTSGTNTGLLLQVEPMYALLLGVYIFKEKFDRGKFSATLLMVLGAVVIIYKGFVPPNIGDIFVLFTTLMFQISHVFVKRLLDKGEDMTWILFLRQLLGGLMLVIFACIISPSFLQLATSPESVLHAGFLGIYLSAVILLWYSAVKKMPLSVASSFLPITALVALIASALFLKETITTQHIFGFILIVSGMLWQAKISTKNN
jgi:drug/metabolite transporter (DMT)-like permease